MQWDITDTVISIHALLAESDALRSPRIALMVGFLSTLSLRRATFACWYIKEMTAFLSTLSLRRATLAFLAINPITKISIHALLAESDPLMPQPRQMRHYFYPRSPCGERRTPASRLSQQSNFYPRSPCGERPCVGVGDTDFGIISIHALLAESDYPDAGGI